MTDSPKPSRRTGQSGDKIDLQPSKLNDNERHIVRTLFEDANPLSIVALANSAFPQQPPNQASSWVRNSLRRLVRGDWVEKLGRGTYTLSTLGRDRWTVESSTTQNAEA